jgi:hypothetical protein
MLPVYWRQGNLKIDSNKAIVTFVTPVTSFLHKGGGGGRKILYIGLTHVQMDFLYRGIEIEVT